MKTTKISVFSFDYHFTFMMHNFVSCGRRRVTVDFQVITTGNDMVQTEVKPGGMWLSICVEVPDFFFKYGRLKNYNIHRKKIKGYSQGNLFSGYC